MAGDAIPLPDMVFPRVDQLRTPAVSACGCGDVGMPGIDRLATEDRPQLVTAAQALPETYSHS